jgi:hypothetical protein
MEVGFPLAWMGSADYPCTVVLFLRLCKALPGVGVVSDVRTSTTWAISLRRLMPVSRGTARCDSDTPAAPPPLHTRLLISSILIQSRGLTTRHQATGMSSRPSRRHLDDRAGGSCIIGSAGLLIADNKRARESVGGRLEPAVGRVRGGIPWPAAVHCE